MAVKVFKGSIVHCKEVKNGNPHARGVIKFEMKEDQLLGVQDGKIIFVGSSAELEDLKAEHDFSNSDITALKPSEFLCPGFIDTHIHASQYCNCGLALDLPLLEWLEKYTFPTESKFQDQDFAKKTYSAALDRSLRHGTTTAQYFATIHATASEILVDLAIEKGQRVFAGKVAMDQNSPDFYVETTRESLESMEKCVQSIQNKQNPLVTPVVTPRFAPTCSMELMQGLGQIAKTYDVPVQTHSSETVPECSWVKELFPQCEDYVDVYDKAGLLGPKTTLAHAIYLSDREIARIKETGTKLSHCPNSNCSIRSGLCDVRKLEGYGVTMGLGTDVSGGYSPSILDAMRYAVTVSNVLAMNRGSSYNPLNYKDAIRMATLEGAKTLNISDKVGSLEVGKDFDALRIDLSPSFGNIDLHGSETLEELVQKFVFLGDDRNICEVYVAGRKVGSEN